MKRSIVTTGCALFRVSQELFLSSQSQLLVRNPQRQNDSTKTRQAVSRWPISAQLHLLALSVFHRFFPRSSLCCSLNISSAFASPSPWCIDTRGSIDFPLNISVPSLQHVSSLPRNLPSRQQGWGTSLFWQKSSRWFSCLVLTEHSLVISFQESISTTDQPQDII